jgi:hypothetical protein
MPIVFQSRCRPVLVCQIDAAEVAAFFAFAHESESVGNSAIEQVGPSDGDNGLCFFPASVVAAG